MISTVTDKPDYMGHNDLYANQSSNRYSWTPKKDSKEGLLEGRIWFANIFRDSHYFQAHKGNREKMKGT